MELTTQSVPSGYKQTEIGVIPVDWDMKNLGDSTTKIGSGKTPTGGEKVYTKDGRPLLRSQNIGWGHLLLDDVAFISDSIHETFPSTEIKNGDVLLNITGASIGRCSIVSSVIVGGNVNQHVCIIRTVKERLNPSFLEYFLLSEKGQKQIDSFQAGGNRQGLNFGQIQSFKIIVPEKEKEQAAIATVLFAIDTLIEKLETLLQKKKNIKQGAMQELLTGKRRLPGFSGEWEKKTLGNVCDIEKGSQINKSRLTEVGKYPVWNGGIAPSGYTENWNTEKSTITISEGGNSCGFVNYCNQRFWCGGHCYAIEKIDGDVHKAFLYHKLKFLQENIMGLRVGSGLPNIQKKNLLNLDLNLPGEEKEQIAITSILSEMDTEIEKLESQLIKYQNLKQGMMQVLLTGKIRLI